jgi:hypothetical protein
VLALQLFAITMTESGDTAGTVPSLVTSDAMPPLQPLQPLPEDVYIGKWWVEGCPNPLHIYRNREHGAIMCQYLGFCSPLLSGNRCQLDLPAWSDFVPEALVNWELGLDRTSAGYCGLRCLPGMTTVVFVFT